MLFFFSNEDLLKAKGLQTSANNVESGLEMLQGDQVYNNAVYTGKLVGCVLL